MERSETNSPIDEEYHVPVLLAEVIQGLQIKPDGVYVDCTFGGGGHAKAILSQLGSKGRLIAFDQDDDAKANVPADERILFIPNNFRHIQRFLKLHGVPLVDGLLADLGVSSHQFDEGERGFSYRFQAPLDMRMDRRQEKTAWHIVDTYSQSALHTLFEKYGEVTNSKTLAARIVEARGHMSLQTIDGFKQALSPIVKGNPNKYFAQVFQALRMEVNDEINGLKELLRQLPEVLKVGGRAAIITFHSIEDREVKKFFNEGENTEVENPFVNSKYVAPLKPINKKPITATEYEMKENKRSRSAKLRIAERKEL